MCVGSEVPGGAPRGTSPVGLCCRLLVEAEFPWGADTKAFTPPLPAEPTSQSLPQMQLSLSPSGTCWGCRPGGGRTEGSRGKGDLTPGRWWDAVRSGFVWGRGWLRAPDAAHEIRHVLQKHISLMMHVK